jgi:LmbE family N-acetylglucosaminyl deacetylase
MTHVFVAPHPDDVALSCGGLIASLRELGQNVTIITVFSGDGSSEQLTAYQREALGFGSKTMWPATEAFNRSDILADWPTAVLVPAWAATEERLDATQADADQAAKRFWQRSSWYRRASVRNESLAGQPVVDDLPTQGAVYTDDVMEAAEAGDLMARRRVEDERFAYFAEASIVFLDLPDAVFRGYEGDEELLGQPRDDDESPFELLRQEIARLEPQKVYFPLGVGGHVDHRLCRDAGVRLLQEGRRWVMPGPEYAGIVQFYEDFPYAWWSDFRRPEDLGDGNPAVALPPNVSISPEYADITDQLERKIMGINLYESQLERLFDGTKAMAQAVRQYGRSIAELGTIDGAAERYWASDRV